MPCGQRVVERGRGRARPRVVQAPRRLRRPVSGQAVLPARGDGRAGDSATSCPTRSASSGSERSWQTGCTSAASPGGTSSSTSTRRCRRGRTSRGSGRRPRRATVGPSRSSPSGSSQPQHAVLVGFQCVPPCVGRSGAPRERPLRGDAQSAAPPSDSGSATATGSRSNRPPAGPRGAPFSARACVRRWR